jgi:amidase
MTFINPILHKTNIKIENKDLPLAQLQGTVKANIPINGVPLSQGNITWDEQHISTDHKTALCVQKLIDAGAHIIGTCHLSAFAFDLSGENSYGIPVNPAVINGVSGGSSSGSASSVATKVAHFSIGTDTGGSIRIPAAYCGVWSFRPTYAAISTEDVIPTGPHYDTVGVMAQNGQILHKVSQVLLNQSLQIPPKQLYAITDLFELSLPEHKDIFTKEIAFLSQKHTINWISTNQLFEAENVLKDLHEASILLLIDTYKTLIPWISNHIPNWKNDEKALTTEVRNNLLLAEGISNGTNKEKIQGLKDSVQKLKEKLSNKLTTDNAAFLLPTVPFPAPDISKPLTPDLIMRMISLTSIASLMGLPQVQMPLLSTPEEKPLGISIIGAPNRDNSLLSFSAKL